MKGNFRVYLYLLCAMFFWGMSFIWYKSAYPEFQPITVILFRLAISFPLILIFALTFKRLKWPKRGDIKYFLLLALFEPFLYFLGESFGIKNVSATLGSVIIATIPLFTPFVGYYFYKEKLTPNNYLGMIVSFVGVLLVVYVEGTAGESSIKGISLMFIAVLSTQGYAILLKNLSKKYNAMSIVGIQNLIGTIYFLPLFFMLDFDQFSWSAYTAVDFLPIIYMAIFASSLAFILFVEGVKAIGISRSTVFTNFIPIITAVFSIFILNETITLIKAVGILVMIFGLFMSQAGGLPKIRIYSRVKK